jgi:hypothetical protein
MEAADLTYGLSFPILIRGVTKMTRSIKEGEAAAANARVRGWRWFMAAIVVTAATAPVTAEARIVRGGAYDGIWNVVFATTRGNCSSGYRVPFTVIGSRVSSAGGGRVSGVVSRNGAVAVRVSVGASRASGGGRLAGNNGAGSWRGVISGDPCSGVWNATRG